VLDKRSPIPLYYQLAETLREQIAAGRLAPGDQLPAERELAEQHGISRMTVRQALQQLIREEVLEAKQGLGTYIAQPKLTYDPLHMLGFTDEMIRRGADVSSRVIEQAEIDAPRSVARRLALGADERVVRIMRLRLSSQVPMLLETVYVPSGRFPGLDRAELSQTSLYHLMRERYGVQPAGATHSFEAALATDYETALFGIAGGAPMIVMQGVTFDQDGVPVEDFKAVYRGDRFAITLDSRVQSAPTMGVPHMAMVMR
jgi:GntR family transcriptional regulator